MALLKPLLEQRASVSWAPGTESTMCGGSPHLLMTRALPPPPRFPALLQGQHSEEGLCHMASKGSPAGARAETPEEVVGIHLVDLWGRVL
jgi:hypothetical protein